MDEKQAWNAIVSQLTGNNNEFPSVPKINKTPVWFSASTDGNNIYIDKATEHVPSSKLSAQRKLNYSTFKKVYPLYLRREKGESVSQEVTSITVNQVYYFSLIKHLANDTNPVLK
ncbi:hypothetical protein [Mesobacillus subterraneus]|uniref:Uncharacterized protein n=1 Tax=Mesobacillus subterraneus TaxID=285983 RepID=A0A427TVS5_9BACI|nr:hypothetical protein [Mesobacillus subterraneus]RSD28598.1 hypothetical protein EJA10_03175 [Mesobacillus subterraneus]